jgi:ferredoxin-type protein NapH
MTDVLYPGREAIRSKGHLKANQWLLIRRASQLSVLALFLAGPWFGVWVIKGNLSASLIFGVVPLTDPYVLLQSLFAGHALASTALSGAAIILILYAAVGGRVFCSFVCPINMVTDASRWLARRLGLPKGWQPTRQTRLWLFGATLAVSAATGTLAWELFNPVSLVHRGLFFGMSSAWTVIGAVFLFDLVVSRQGWCGHLCPMGAFYGLIGKISLVRISAKRRLACNDCMDCFAVCPEPHVIPPALKSTDTGYGPLILSGDCTNCGRCIDICPVDVFAFDLRFNNPMPVQRVGSVNRLESTTRGAA